jgi:hypothetical protein
MWMNLKTDSSGGTMWEGNRVRDSIPLTTLCISTLWMVEQI